MSIKSAAPHFEDSPRVLFRRAFRAMKNGNKAELADVAPKLAVHVQKDERLAQPLLIMAEQLAKKPEHQRAAIDTSLEVATHALSDPDSRQRAMAIVYKHQGTLPDPVQEAMRTGNIFLRAEFGTRLEQQYDTILTHLKSKLSPTDCDTVEQYLSARCVPVHLAMQRMSNGKIAPTANDPTRDDLRRFRRQFGRQPTRA